MKGEKSVGVRRGISIGTLGRGWWTWQTVAVLIRQDLSFIQVVQDDR